MEAATILSESPLPFITYIFEKSESAVLSSSIYDLVNIESFKPPTTRSTIKTMSHIQITTTELIGSEWNTSPLKKTSHDCQSNTLMAMNDLTNEYCIDSLPQNALQLLIQMEEKNRSLLGEEHPATLSAMTKVASNPAYMARHQQKVVDLSSDVRDMGSRDTLMALNNLANSYNMEGYSQEAVSLHQKVLQYRTKLLGDEHMDTLTTMNNLAICFIKTGSSRKAMTLQEKVVHTRQKVHGKEHNSTLLSMENLAAMYSNFDYSTEDSTLRKELDDHEHLEQLFFHRLSFLESLAQTFDKLGQLKKANDLHKSALKITRRLYDWEHETTLAVVHNLAVNYAYQGLNEEAAKHYTIILDMCQKGSAAKRLTRLRCMSNFAFCLSCLGSTQEAFDMHHQVIEECTAFLDSQHPVTINAISKLRDSYHQSGQHEEALRLERYMLKASKRVTRNK